MEPEKLAQARPWLLTGGSGMIGQGVAAALGRHGIPCRQAARPGSLKGGAAHGALVWDPHADKPFADTAALEGLGTALHLSGANVAGRRWTPAFKREIAESRTASTRALARTLAALDRPPALLISASAIGFYGDRGDTVLTEDAAAGSGIFPEICAAWEAATAPAEEAGIRVVHLRIGVVMSPEGGALAKVLPLFRAGLGGRLGTGRQWMSWIALDDVVRAVLHIAGRDDSGGTNGLRDALRGAVNCVAPNPVTNAEYTRVLAQTLHRPAFVAAPAFALRLAVGEMADAALLASCRVHPRSLLESGFLFRYPELGPALRHLLPS